MRIIDKNYDFYDYLQCYDDPIVFDRRGSILLSKEYICECLKYNRTWYQAIDMSDKEHYVLIQCGATYWLLLFKVTATKSTHACYILPTDYSIELITSWKNYNRPREIIKIYLVSFKTWTINRNDAEALSGEVDNRNIRLFDLVGTKTDASPILKACGISEVISAEEIFNAIEEHFSLLKTEYEKTEPIDATNDDKIVMHGFDTKTSFRGKEKK